MKTDYDLFCEYMQRYKAGERENSEERKSDEYMASTGIACMTSSYSTFLRYMQKYQSEKLGERHI